jgi:hypothetical protein
MGAGGLRPAVGTLGAALAFGLAATLAACSTASPPGTGGTDGPVGTGTASAPLASGTATGAPASASTGATDGADGADATSACRSQWAALAASVAGRDLRADPSDLPARWAPVVATAAHYRLGATPDDCVGPDSPLAQTQDTITRIEEFSSRLRAFDIAHRTEPLAAAGADYLRGRLPRPHAAGPGQRPPTKAQVRRALTVLERQTAASVADMQDGWDEAAAVDLSDRTAVRRTVADLRFLARDSAPFRACVAALAVLARAASFS